MKKVKLPQEAGWKYLDEIDRLEYRNLSAAQKLHIAADLNNLWYLMMRHSPSRRRILNALESLLTDKLRSYQRINRVLKYAK